MSIYVGNLPNEVTQGDVSSVFAEYVTLNWVKLPINRETSRRRGVSFVEMETEAVETVATEALDGDEWMGRALEVSQAKPHEERGKTSGSLRNKSGGYV